MSDVQVITKFELLPNEIILECFEYLDAIDIFNSFDFLNSRFCNLIRNTSLCLNVGEIEKSKLVQFGIKMLLNPEIKKQITSLKLTRKDNFDNIKILFSFLSLNEFSQLRALILSGLDMMTIDRISSMLSLLTSLQYFCLENSFLGIDTVVTSLSTSNIETILIPIIPSTLSLDFPFFSLVNLTISSCSINRLCEFLEYSPGLQYLYVKDISQSDNAIFDQSLVTIDQAVSLKRLIIDNFSAGFDALEILLQRTPNLKVLVISADCDDLDLVNASRWRKLIKNSLPLLDVFKFQFSFDIEDDGHGVVDEFQQFQTSFWCHEHHWYTEYVLNKDRAVIYTAPYASTKYEITSNTKRYNNKLINNMNTFKNVIDLKLCVEAMTNTDKYYFPSVKSLKLNNDSVNINHDSPFFKIKHIQYLKTMINLCNLTHLEISSECRLKSSSVILQLFKETPNLSSLTIDKNILIAMFNNRELCEYFNKRIKELRVTESSTHPFPEANEILKVCQIFSNMRTFQCYVGSTNDLIMILDQLSKLSYMKAFTYKTDSFTNGNRWLENHKSELDLYPFTIKCVYSYDDDDDDDYIYPYDDYYMFYDSD